MQQIIDIRRVIAAVLAVMMIVITPMVSAMVPPACCLEGGMLNDPQLETHSHMQEHCDEMAETSVEETGMCTSNCTGSCCSIYLSVGMALPATNLPAEFIETSFVRPANVAAVSLSGRFPTPPPRA